MMNMLLNLRNVLTARELFTPPYLLHKAFRHSPLPLSEHTYTLWPSGRWAFSFCCRQSTAPRFFRSGGDSFYSYPLPAVTVRRGFLKRK